jgi:UDP-glucose 4-epimerase
MKVLVTGGAGFIGSHITDVLLENGFDVIVMDDLSSGRKENVNPGAKLIEADVTRAEALQILRRESPNFIVHHAAQISVSRSVKAPYMDARTNIMGTLNMLEFARLTGVKKFVFASSGGTIYGDPKEQPIIEKYPYNPMSPYGISKAVIEWYLRFYNKEYGLQYTSLRYSNVYGPRQDPHGEAGVVAIFARKLLAGEACTINGDGKYVRDYVYCRDVARANLLALKSNITGGFNICTEVPTDVNRLYKKLSKALGIEKKPLYGPPRAGDLRKSVLSYAKAKKVLKWKPEVTLDEGLKKTAEYFILQAKG